MRTSLRFTTAMLALCLSLFTFGAAAQTSTTGSIEGTVIDVNGAAVPGVTVTVSGSNMIRAQTAVTNDEGVYRIPNIPPGRYTVSVAADRGFAAFERTDVEVNLSRTSAVAVTLRPAGTTETVEVTATSGANIDVTTNTTGTNISTEQFSNFPTQRTVQSLYTIAPTVTRSGLRDASGRDRDPSVGGSSGPENNYILDGVTVTDPAFGGSGANLPFEFVQEIEIKTGGISAEYGKSTGGIFNVVTKSGSNEFHGDAFLFFTPESFVREVKSSAIPFTGSAPNGFSEVDAGFDIGGPIIKDKLWFFGAFNPQRRKNFYLTQTFLQPVENKITTPFYAGKITWGINQNHVFNFSTFGDYTKQEGFLFGGSGFGADPQSFRGRVETGGSNYTARLNSTFSPTFTGEFSFGLHLQRANTIPEGSTDVPLIADNFAVRSGSNILSPVNTTATVPVGASGALQLAYIDGRGATSLERNFIRQGFGLFSQQDRDRVEGQARFQNVWGKHTFKYGLELAQNRYNILTRPTGPALTLADPNGQEAGADHPATEFPFGYRITNNFGVCTVQGSNVACPAAALTTRVNAIISAGQAPAGITSASTNAALTSTELGTNPFLVLSSVRIRDFVLNTNGEPTTTNTQSFYVQDDFKVTRNITLNLGARWDYQQSYGTQSDYLKFNRFKDNLQPRLGFIWDFTGEGRGKVFANFARFIETPIPLDINVRAGGDDIQLDRNANISRLNGAPGAVLLQGTAAGLGCLGCHATPGPEGLKPQDVYEWTAGVEYEVARGFALGFRGIYRNQDSVVEDGSFDDGHTYFLFNPGETTIEQIIPLIEQQGPLSEEERAFLLGRGDIFGRARRYYRALEFTATKRFSNNYQFISSYVYSSLIGNYEGLFRNDNGQADPNITSLFDLPELLPNTYGRLPNDRPHQFKLDGSYQWPFKLMTSASFRVQSGRPFDSLIPHFLYGNNEGFDVPRGTAINPVTGRNRTPTTYNLDLGVYYPIQFGENRQLRFQADWFNVTNTQRALTQDQTLRINSGIPGAQFIQFNNPFYGQGQIFQFPSALRLGVKFSF
ncbi:MAG TPA: TonB-dependent receptor [Pyrinomonadaceae bacterium]|nr:TonB-dependent receptor [Pyrinomonadaceae bacterium]